MNNAQEQLEFAVKLAQLDLLKLRPGDLLNLRDDFQAFFYRRSEDIRGPIGEVVMPSAEPLPAKYELGDFQSLQKNVYEILSELVHGRDAAMPAMPVRKIAAELTLFSFLGMKNRSVLILRGSTQDMFLFRLYIVLSREPFDRILRCKASDCEQLFYRRRKQEFCSTKCANREFQRRYRKLSGAKDARSRENHERYEKRIGKTAARRPRQRVDTNARKKKERG